MLEVAAALCAGLSVVIAVLAAAAPAPQLATDAPGSAWLRRRASGWWNGDSALAAATGWPWLDPRRLVVGEFAAASFGAFAAMTLTGLPVLAVPGAIGAFAVVRMLVRSRARSQQVKRQDAVLDSVRMLRQLLETGATSVHQAIVVLGARGPTPLRSEFRHIAATTVGRRQAWSSARDRVAEPLFDMLAAAVLIQGPGGGELIPLFADLEASVTAAQEVEREAQALQVQARSAANIIVALPIAFLIVLSAFHSPYLDVFHHQTGEVFLLLMVATMGGSYVWMRRLLRLPGLERVRLSDA
jgi:Flp pilus assembly protein TadB